MTTVITFLVMLSVIIATVGAWYYSNQQAQKVRQELEGNNLRLQNQIHELKKAEEKSSNNSASPKSIRDFNLKNLEKNTELGRNYKENLYADLTGDGQEEAVVVFVYEGTGSFKDFYIYKMVNNEPKLYYAKSGLNQGVIKITTLTKNGLPVVTATWIDPSEGRNLGKSNSEMVVTDNTKKQYKWNGAAFIETALQ